MPARLRSSSSIRLVLAGSLVIAGCGEDEATQRNVYASYEDCKADWGGEARKCVPTENRGGSTGTASSGTHYWYGPEYRVPDRKAGQPTGRGLSAQVTRGGLRRDVGFPRWRFLNALAATS